MTQTFVFQRVGLIAALLAAPLAVAERGLEVEALLLSRTQLPEVSHTTNIFVYGDRVFPTQGSHGGTAVFDIGVAGSPMLEAFASSACDGRHVSAYQDFILLSDLCGGLWIYLLNGTMEPTQFRGIGNDPLTIESLVHDEHLFVADGFDGPNSRLRVFTFSDPTDVSFVGQLEGYDLWGMARFGDTIFATAAYPEASLLCIDVADPAMPSVVGTIGLGDASSLVYRDGLVYIASDEDGLWVVDVRDPASPALAGVYETDNRVTDIDLFGGVAVVGTASTTVEFVDVREPSLPALIGQLDVGLAASRLDVEGSRLFIAHGADGFSEYSLTSGCGCPADLDGDCDLDVDDVGAFLDAYGANDPAGDFNGDGSWTFFDVSGFLTAYNAGCP